jgi:endonuclease/exonuclease/phosphatase (EEP) superfamily protein YafD
MLLGFAGAGHWALDLCAHFRWQYLAVLAMGLLAALIGRHWRTAAGLLAGSILNAWALIAASGPVQAPAAIIAGSEVKLLVANVHVGLTDVRPLLQLIRSESPDVIGIIELSPATAAALAELSADYPLQLNQPQDDPFGIGLWTRMPGAKMELSLAPPLELPVLQMTTPTPALKLWLVHPFPPLGARGSQARDQQLSALALAVGPDPLALVAGDLNTSPWSAAYRQLRADTRLQDSRAGHWPWPTWYARGGISALLAVPIDHVLHGSAWRVLEWRVGPDIGSDHRPVIVTLAVAVPDNGAAEPR